MAGRFEVSIVFPDGNPQVLMRRASLRQALEDASAIREANAGKSSFHVFVTDSDDEERGTLSELDLFENGGSYNDDLKAVVLPKKIKVRSIELERAEGPSVECGPAGPFATWNEANAQLNRWSHSAPKSGGYDKVDTKVTWEDGSVYSMRYDMVHMCSDGFLNVHLTRALKFYVTDQSDRAVKFRKQLLNAEEVGYLRHILERCALNDRDGA